VKLPEPSAVAEPEAAASNVTVTVSPEENPEPVAVVFVVGGPDFGESKIDALAAKLAAEKVPARRIPRSIIRRSMVRLGIIGTAMRLKHEETVEIMTPPLWLQAQPMLRFIAECRAAFV
jgi:hypothetical protein